MKLLPKLAVISDQSVERSASGQLLFYRLLESYPAERLRVIEGTTWPTDPALRLPGVVYNTIDPVSKRIAFSGKMGRLLGFPAYRTIGRRGLSQVRTALGDFRPEAILTVTHGPLCMTAVETARSFGIPYHTVSYDEWTETWPVHSWYRSWAESHFQSIYRGAASRFCVSPYMVENYEQRTGVRGEVLYPSRGEASPEPRLRLRSTRGRFTIAYFGSLFADYEITLTKLADVLSTMDGHLLVFSQHCDRLPDHPAIEKMGFQTPQAIAEVCEQRADALFLPMSFMRNNEQTMRTAFPSKLADYTAIGLPILICGPTYCSAIRWAEQHSGVSLSITDTSSHAFRDMLNQIRTDPTLSKSLAETALIVGNHSFSLDHIRRSFFARLKRRDSYVERATLIGSPP